MELKHIKELLSQQMELLAEQSKNADYTELNSITLAMLAIAEFFTKDQKI